MSLGFNHAFFVELFRQRPLLAAELLRRCAGRSIPGEHAELASNDLTQVVPIEYRADAVIILRDAAGNSTHAIVVEVQLTTDPRIARQYVAQGRQEGRQEGRSQLMELLVFRPISSETESRLKALDDAQQRVLLQNALAATTLEEALATLDG